MRIETIKKKKSDLKLPPNLKDWEKIYKKFDWKEAEKSLDWFPGHKINAAYNAIDRHEETDRKNKVALYWMGEDGTKKEFTFWEMKNLSNQVANVLKKHGVERGDRVFLFLPRVPELFYGFLGILKTGAIAGTMFQAFGPEGVRDRLQNSQARFLITDSELVKRIYKVKKDLPNLEKIFIVDAKPGQKLKTGEVDFQKEMKEALVEFKVAEMEPDDYAFMLYTSGTTGKPKGVVHRHLAILQEHFSAKWVLDIHDEDIYWCVPPETVVFANPKPKRIDEIKIGEKVLAHNGKFSRVLKLFKRKYRGDLIKLHTRYSNIPMFLTPNHSVLVGQRGKQKIQWKPAGLLTKEDFVLFPRLKEIKDKNKIKFSENVAGCKNKDGLVHRRKLKIKLEDQIKIDKKFMRLVGYYLAEGSLTRGAVQFAFNPKEIAWAKDVQNLVKQIFNLRTKTTKHKEAIQLQISSVILRDLFYNLFDKVSEKKKLPDWMLYLPEDKLKELVRGFFRGDGDITQDGFRISTSSSRLAFQLRLILNKLGLILRLEKEDKQKIRKRQVGRRIKSRHDHYILRITGQSVKTMAQIVSYQHPFIKKRWCTYHRGYMTNKFIWVPIRAIQKINYNGWVYNLKTNANTYVLNNMTVHNCTADPGWVTGIAYEILGVWSIGASSVIYSGRFDPATWYKILQDYEVTVWYTAPTAIRMLAKAGVDLVKKYDLSHLRHMCSVGEPLNPEPIKWGLKAFKLPFHDNWWQTETGGICIANCATMDIKLGSMGKPIPGVVAEIVSDKGDILGPNKEGNLALKPGWPSQMKNIWRRPEKFKSYFKKSWYITGDRAYKDKNGYFWFIGRADDVIKTAGERVGPFEVESALIDSGKVIEAGVIGKPDPERGEIIKAFCVLKGGVKPSENLKAELSTFVKKHLAGHAYPKEVEFVDKLPKTRSGKIMRRVLKAKELGLPIGDISTLEEY